MFLRKVRLGKELEAVGKDNVTPEEQTILADIQEVFAAGEEALRAGRDDAASILFIQAEETLAKWMKSIATHREKEIRAEAVQRAEKRRLEKAQQKLKQQRMLDHRGLIGENGRQQAVEEEIARRSSSVKLGKIIGVMVVLLLICFLFFILQLWLYTKGRLYW